MAERFPFWEIKTDKDCKKFIGKIAYEAYTPSKVGKIVDCFLLGKKIIAMCSVKMLKDKSIVTTQLAYLNDYEKLTETTERKATNHRKQLEKAKKL
jgi:hypothetical protein